MLVVPAVDEIPRMISSFSPGPAETTTRLGVWRPTSWSDWMSSRCRSCSPIAVMLRGTVWMFSARFWAVTTISETAPESLSAVGAGAAAAEEALWAAAEAAQPATSMEPARSAALRPPPRRC